MGKRFELKETDKSIIKKEDRFIKKSKTAIKTIFFVCVGLCVSELIGANRKHDDSTKS